MSHRIPNPPHHRTASSMVRCLPAFAALFLASALLPAPRCAAQDLRTPEQHLLQGHADQAAAELQAMLARNAGNGPAHLLLCRVFLSTLHGSEAAAECRLALKNGLDRDSSAQDWAGRAFGMNAEHAGPIAGMKLATQVHTAFDSAFNLNPHSAAAANDLGEYFVNAPFIVGGGTDKALTLATTIQPTLPEIALRLRALVAEKRGNAAAAEQNFVAATQVAQSPGAFVDLATFYNRQGNQEKAAAAARRAIQLNRAVDANVVDAAGALGDAHQPSQAIQALRTYLARGQQSDQAPAFRAHTMLGEMLAAQGNRAEARKEFTAALAMAADYAPARKGLGSL